MFNLFSKRRCQTKLNTLALHGDLDDVEILEDIEATFGIKFTDQDAEKMLTIGD